VLSVLASRVDLFAAALTGDAADLPSLRAALSVLHYDLAGAPVEEQLAALLSVADPSRLPYGSDFPFTPWQACQYLAQQQTTSPQLDNRALDAVFADNAAGCAAPQAQHQGRTQGNTAYPPLTPETPRGLPMGAGAVRAVPARQRLSASDRVCVDVAGGRRSGSIGTLA
jgi:hypothetical protein